MSLAPPQSGAAVAGAPVSGAPRRGVTALRFLPIDTYPQLIDLAQRPTGRALLLALFALALVPLNPAKSLPITIAAGACAYAGRYRNAVRTFMTMSLAFARPDWFLIYWPPPIAPRDGLAGRLDVALALWPMLVAVFLLSVLAMHFVRRYRPALPARHPVVSLLALFAALVLLACSGYVQGRPQILLWTFVAVFGAYFWFLCYALADQRARDGSAPLVQLGVFHPFWGSTTTPIGKGAAYLRKFEAKDARELAITQLKGLKLLVWVLVLIVLNHALSYAAQGAFAIPDLEDAIAKHVAGHSYPWYVCLASLIYTFFHNMLEMAIFGGPIVAVARLAGYRLLRNTYRPLSATTLVEFWNRYYFYYKELLVEFFFFPTFFRCFQKHKRVRIFFATFMAASVGNFIFHFMRDIYIAAQFGLVHQLLGFQSFAFYCLVLGSGIGLSQMRIHRQKTGKTRTGQRLASTASVLGFYCLLSIFSSTFSEYSLANHFSFLFHVFGVG